MRIPTRKSAKRYIFIAKYLKLFKINYLTALCGFGLLLESVYLTKSGFLAAFLFFIFNIAVFRKFSRKINAFVFMLAFSLSSVVLTSIYGGMAVHFLITGMSLSFLILLIAFADRYDLSSENDEYRVFHSDLERLAKLLVVFFWFLGYFYDGFGGIIFRNLLSVVLMYFLIASEFENFDWAAISRQKNIFIFGLITAFIEFAFVLNFLIAVREAKTLIFVFCYLAATSIINKILNIRFQIIKTENN